MTRPHDISQAIWDEVISINLNLPYAHVQSVIARALSDAYARGIEDAAKICDRLAEEHTGDYVGMLCAAAIRALGSK